MTVKRFASHIIISGCACQFGENSGPLFRNRIRKRTSLSIVNAWGFTALKIISLSWDQASEVGGIKADFDHDASGLSVERLYKDSGSTAGCLPL